MVLLSSDDLDLLDRSLDALSLQDLQAPYEILVVGDAFDAAIARMIANWASRLASRPPQHHASLRYQASAGAAVNPASALNQGWQAACAPLIAFTAIDTVPARDWLRAGLAAFEVSGPSLSAPPPSPSPSAAPLPSTSPDPAQAGMPEAVFGRVDCRLPKHPTEAQLHVHTRDAARFAACNWFIRRATLERLGGFDARFSDGGDETVDLICRLLAGGVPLAHAPGATVFHPVGPASWGASLLETRRLCSEALLLRKYPQLYRQHLQGPAPPVWHDLAVTAALLLAVLGLFQHQEILAVATGGSWLVLTAMLCIRRLRDTARTPGHVAEVVLTSPFVPVLALFWRLVGALRYRTRFAQP